MGNPEIINQINSILNEKEIDERVKPIIKLFFVGKLKTGDISIEQLQTQIDILCSRINNLEFTSSEKIVAAYESKNGTLTINKQMFLEGKSDEIILPVFMKFEEALNQESRNTYGNHIEDFIRAGRIATVASVPMTERLYRLYEMAEYCYGDIEYKIEDLISDGTWKSVCDKYNDTLNSMIITGTDDQKALLDGVRLFHSEIFTSELLQNPQSDGPFKTEEYQRKAAKILACLDTIQVKSVKNFLTGMKDVALVDSGKDGLVRNIKTFTGCTDEMIENAKSERYTGDPRISYVLESTIKGHSEKITEEFIVSRVQEVLDRKPGYDNRVKHLLIPLFIRSQKIYNWDIDQFQERLNQIDLKIDKIIFEELDDISNSGSTAIDTIKLNSRVFLNKKGEIIWPVAGTLFHELGHNTDKNTRESIKSKEQLQNAALGHGRFYEWTNTVFERLVKGGNFYKKDDALQMSEAGYEALAPIGSMLASALGIQEIEFARIKDKGKDYEEQILSQFFPSQESGDLAGSDMLNKIKEIFDKYELDTYFSLSKKRSNQSLLNEAYAECLKIMQKRIEIQSKSGNIENLEEYKKNQMFYLKKMNVNFKAASKADGFRISRAPIVHDIGFCNDAISNDDLMKIAEKHTQEVSFGFDNNSLSQYRVKRVSKSAKSFDKSIKVPLLKKETAIPEASLESLELEATDRSAPTHDDE